MDQLSRLQNWYAAQCNGTWEHSFGVKIDTLDNPGWRLHVDLTGTELQDRSFTTVNRGESADETSWLHCKIESGTFHAAGGIANLPEMLDVFLAWAGY